jgi:hypothetical protein
MGQGYRFRRTAPAVVTNLGQGIALPNVIGFWGLATDPQTEGAGARLPALLPEEAGGLRLTVDPDTLLLRVEPGQEITSGRPDWHFLARWWVNGKPFFPRPVLPIPQRGGVKLDFSDEDVAMQLRLDAKKLGARPGDRVELQLLYCPSGWLPVENPPRGEQRDVVGFPVLTNRVAFRVP